MKNKIKLGLVSLSVLLPVVSSAQYLSGTNGIAEGFLNLIDIAVPMAFALAMLYFFYGIAKYIRSEGEGKDEGRRIMVWGVVALFVMSSVWGLVYFLRGEFNISDDSVITLPRVQ